MTPEISIIIPTYKRPASLEKTLISIDRFRPSNSEVIVVDQSPDSTEYFQMISTQFPFVNYIHLSEPNLPEARNEGIRNSSGGVIFFTDDDAVLDPACLNEHMVFHSQNDISAVAGRIKQMGDISWADTSLVTEINRKTGEAVGNFDLDYEGEVLYASGGHFSIKRELIEVAGLFNSRFRGNALFEDVEFFTRVRKRGYTVMYNPRAVIYHYPEKIGGCHESEGPDYLTERLYNHMLFYILAIRIIPSKECIMYMKNLIEFISRKKDKGHNPLRIISCLFSVIKAYRNAVISKVNIPRLTR